MTMHVRLSLSGWLLSSFEEDNLIMKRCTITRGYYAFGAFRLQEPSISDTSDDQLSERGSICSKDSLARDDGEGIKEGFFRLISILPSHFLALLSAPISLNLLNLSSSSSTTTWSPSNLSFHSPFWPLSLLLLLRNKILMKP